MPFGLLDIGKIFGRIGLKILSLFSRNEGKEVKVPFNNVFGYVEGREFGQWTDTVSGGARSNGYNEGDLIDCPPYIIESLLRDEMFVERDLVVTSTASTTTAVIDDLQVRTDDYYNYAEWYNATNAVKSHITDYVASTNTLTINDADASLAANDNVFLTNVQGDLKIDYASFDTIGNTTNGTRKDWVFGRVLNYQMPIQELIDEVCFESHCMLTESVNEDTGATQIRLIALDEASAGDTWTKPAFINGRESVRTYLSSLESVATSFELFYHYDYGKQDYLKNIKVNKQGYTNPSGGSTITDEHMNLCKVAEQAHRITNPFSYSANWIYDDATAEHFLDKKINWFTKQRLIVDWISGLSDGTTDFIKYEKGDQVKLNYTKAIPSGLNNSAYFMITSKRIITVQGAPLIHFQLIDMS